MTLSFKCFSTDVMDGTDAFVKALDQLGLMEQQVEKTCNSCSCQEALGRHTILLV